MNEKAKQVLLSSKVVVTSSDIKAKELFTKIVESIKKDEEKDEKERTLLPMIKTPILFIKPSDYKSL